jgi:hypothetical protein
MASGATLRVIFFGLALLATCGPGAAGPRERTLAPALLDLVQDALWLTGDYSGPINNRASAKDINEALKAFRAREGLAAGEGGHREIEKLKARARAVRATLGLEPVIDAVHNIVMMVPRALLPHASRADKGRRFVSADGKAMLATFARPGGRPALAKLRDELAAGQSGRSSALTADGLLLASEEAGTTLLVRASENAGMVKGVIFSYPASHADRYERVARYVLASFDPTPQLPRSAPLPAPAADEPTGSVRSPTSASLRNGEEPNSASIVRGSIVARMSLARPDDLSADTLRPVLEIKADGQTVTLIDARRTAEDWTSASIEIATLDPKATHPAVMFVVSADAGGCCTEASIAVATENGSWRVLEAGPFRGVPRLVDDPERPGGQVLVGELAAFHGTFGPPETATAPLTILRLEGEWLTDVTHDAAFRPMHAAQLSSNLASAKAAAFRSNGVWPGIVGSARLIGEGDEAAALMEKYHDPTAYEGRQLCTTGAPITACSPGEIRIRPLATAIDELLAEAGFGL